MTCDQCTDLREQVTHWRGMYQADARRRPSRHRHPLDAYCCN